MQKLFGKKEIGNISEELEGESKDKAVLPVLEYRFTRKDILQEIQNRLEGMF